MSRALIKSAASQRPGSSAGGRLGTAAAPPRTTVAGLPARPNTSASVRGNEILHLPNEWALDGAMNLDEKDFLLGVVKQVRARKPAFARLLGAPSALLARCCPALSARATTERRVFAIRERETAARPRRSHGRRTKQGVFNEVRRGRAGRGPELHDEGRHGVQPHVQVCRHQSLRVLAARSLHTAAQARPSACARSHDASDCARAG